MELTVASLTDVGRVRSNNEDNFLSDAKLGLFVVCDGMGGHSAGEVASQLCCAILARELAAAPSWRQQWVDSGQVADLEGMQAAVGRAIARASEEIHRQASHNRDQAGMGTTCTVLLVAGRGKAVLGHVGDSRLYLVRAGRAHQLSEDHSYVNELVKRGALTAEQAARHPQGNILSRAMGVQAQVQVDTLIFDLDVGDTLLLCSDGVHHYYPEIAEVAAALTGDDLPQRLHALLAGALARGGHDNCTGIAIRVDGSPAVPAALQVDARAQLLAEVPLFAGLSYQERLQAMGPMQLAEVPAGAWLYEANSASEVMYVLLAGEIEAVEAAADAPGPRRGPGSLWGLEALLGRMQRPAGARACTPVHVLGLRRAPFLSLVTAQPVLGAKLLSALTASYGSTPP